MRWSERFAPLRERNFRLLWAGQTVSALGSGMYPVALSFAVLDLTGKASDLGLVLIASYAPQVVFFLVGGVVADRLPRQRIMLVGFLVRGIAETAMAILLLTGNAALWQFVLLGIVFGVSGAFAAPAGTGLLATIVRPDGLQSANALMSLSRNTAQLIGPAAAGVLVALVGPGWVLLIDAATFFFEVLALALMRVPARGSEGAESGAPSFLRELREGWGAVTSRSWVWVSIVYFGVFNLALAPVEVLGPFVADRSLGGAPAFGVISAAASAGSLLGGVMALRYRPRRPLFAGYLVAATCGLIPLAYAVPLGVPAIALAALIGWGGTDLGVTFWFTTLQQRVPEHVLSRVSSFDYLGSFVAVPLGYALAGPLAAAAGLGPTLAWSGVLLIGCSVAAAFVPSVRRLERVDTIADEGRSEDASLVEDA